QTFHTPSFGDEDFDIPPINPSHSAVPSSISYHQPPASTDTMTMTTMSDHHTSPYQQPLYLSPTHDHMPLSLSGSYGGGYPGLGQHSSLHLLQSYSMGPPQSTVRSPQGPPTSHQTTSPQAPHPHETTTTSDDSDDSTPHTQMMAGMKRPSPEPTDNGLAKMQKKPKAQKKKKKRDPNEPQKPVSAYALFFRDTQAAIKGQNPNASFGEVSKIVASMWDTLDADHKNVYKKKTEAAKKDYLKALAAYRASLVSKGASEPEPIYTGYGGYGGGYSGYSPPTGLPSPPMSAPSPQHHLKKPIHMPESRQSQQSQQVMMGHLGQQQQHIQQQQQQPPPQQVNQNSNYMQQQQQQQVTI
ncbi:hypothetical protein AAG570_000448, partial [Ranatra chinensis]